MDADLTVRRGPFRPILDHLDPGIAALGDLRLTPQEFGNLVAFLRQGLLDRDARPERLCRQIPTVVPSGLKVLKFQGCPPSDEGGDEEPQHSDD